MVESEQTTKEVLKILLITRQASAFSKVEEAVPFPFFELAATCWRSSSDSEEMSVQFEGEGILEKGQNCHLEIVSLRPTTLIA